MVRQRFAKPPFEGSIPSSASNFSIRKTRGNQPAQPSADIGAGDTILPLLMKALLHRHRFRLCLGLTTALLVGALLGRNLSFEACRHALGCILDWARGTPFPLFILLVGALPMIGVPVTALYLAAGAVYTPLYGLPATLGGLSLGLLLNLLLSYAAAHTFRSPVERLLGGCGTSMPQFDGMPAWKIVLLVRITPGAPLMVQNFLLGLAKISLRPYLAVSLLAELTIALGYLTIGSSFGSGRWGFLAAGGGIVAAALLAVSLARDRMHVGKRPASRR